MLNEKAFKISEQCMQNYLLYYVFYNKKYLSLSQMFDMNFGSNKDVVLNSINVLLNIFYSEDMYSFVETEVNIIWDK